MSSSVFTNSSFASCLCNIDCKSAFANHIRVLLIIHKTVPHNLPFISVVTISSIQILRAMYYCVRQSHPHTCTYVYIEAVLLTWYPWGGSVETETDVSRIIQKPFYMPDAVTFPVYVPSFARVAKYICNTTGLWWQVAPPLFTSFSQFFTNVL